MNWRLSLVYLREREWYAVRVYVFTPFTQIKAAIKDCKITQLHVKSPLYLSKSI